MKLDVCQVLIDAGVEIKQRHVAKRLALAGDRYHETLPRNQWEVALTKCSFGDEFVGPADDDLMNLCAGNPRDVTALPIGLVGSLRRRAISDFRDNPESHYLPTLRNLADLGLLERLAAQPLPEQ